MCIRTRLYVIAILGLALIIWLCALGYGRWCVSQVDQEMSYFALVLRRAGVQEKVSINGGIYSVVDGEVQRDGAQINRDTELRALRLAYAKALARHSPLLAMPGSDPDSFDKAVDQLVRIREELSRLQKNKKAADTVRSGLYPVVFLHAAADIERARQTFLKDGDEKSMQAYQRTQQNAVHAYVQDIEKFKTAFIAIVPRNANIYVDAAYIITPDGILKTVDSLRHGIGETARKIAARDRCIAGDVEACNSNDLEEASLPLPEIEPLSPEAKAAARDSLSLITESNSPMPNTYTGRPILLDRSACAGGMDRAPLFVFRLRTLLDDHSLVRPFYIGDLRFTRVDDSKSGFDEFMRRKDVEYVYDSAFRHYTCLALAEDYAKTYPIDYVISLASSTPLSAYAKQKDASALRLIERQLATGTVSEADAVAYIATAANLDMPLPVEIRNRLETIRLQMVDRSAGLEEFIRMMTWIEDLNTKLSTDEKVPVDLDAQYLFYVRSAFLALFMGGNPSFVGVQQVPLQINNLPPSQEPYVYFSLLTPRERDRAVHDLRIFTAIHTYPSD